MKSLMNNKMKNNKKLNSKKTKSHLKLNNKIKMFSQ